MSSKVNRGAFVNGVEEDSAAEKAGIQAGDIISELNGNELTGFHELRAKIASMGAGAEVELTLIRKGEELKVDVILGDATQNIVAAKEIHPALEGATLANGTDGRGNQGVEVTELEARSPAARIGLRVDDFILGVNRTRVNTVTELRNVMDDTPGVIALSIRRGNTTRYLVIR